MEPHSLLARQLKKFFGSAAAVGREIKPFVAAVNEAYKQSDLDRGLLERSLELSSQEMMELLALRQLAEAELKSKMAELELINDAAIDRELKMIELEKEVNGLLVELGRPLKYKDS